MRKNMAKLLSALLSVIMLISLLPSISVMAADEVVLFEDDFENLAEDEQISIGTAWNQWTDKVGLDITHGRAVKEGKNTVIQFFNADSEKMRGPRFEKVINASLLTNMTISYKAKAQDANLILQIYADGEDKSNTGGIITAHSQNKWAEVKVTINFKDLTYTVNGKEGGKLKSIKDLSTFTIRFTQTLSDASYTWLDAVKITTTDKVDPANLTGNASAGEFDASELAGPEIDPVSGAVVVKNSLTNRPPVVRTAGSNILFEDDAEGYGTDGKVPTGNNSETWTDYTSSANSVVGVIDNGGNKVISYGNPSANPTYPRMEKLLEYKGLKKLHIQFSVKPHGSNFTLRLMNNGASIEALVQDSSKEDWQNYTVTVDVEKSQYSVKLNGSEIQPMQALSSKIESPTSLLLRFESRSDSGVAVYLDNVLISTPDNVTSAQLLIGNEGENYFVNFDNVNIPNPDAAISPSMLRAHPRIFVTDWEEMRQKAKSSPEFASWYARIKVKADEILEGPTEEFVLMQGATLSVLQQARNLFEKILVLGLVYNVEQDPIYAERAWKEIDATNHFEHWSPTEAYLATAEMSFGYAVAYDWFYYAFTDAQKAEMISALKAKCLAPLVFNYEDRKTGTNFTTSSVNWNNVCNGSSAIMALSMYEEFPQLAEYVLQKSMTYIQNALPALAPEGAYAEGPMYWGLCIDYTVRMAAAVDSAFKNPADIPENYIIYNASGVAKTADFPVYYSAYTGSFNYGDAALEKAGTDVMYWFASKFNTPQHAWYERNLDYEKGGPAGVLGFIWFDGNAELTPGAFSLDRSYHHDTLHNGISMRSSWENDKGLFVSMMGGYNQSGHQFLANGTFMLESKGIRWITMRGAGNYTYTDYFDSNGNDATRWTYYVARAEGQNTIIANPGVLADQESNAVGKLIGYGSATNEAFGIFDIASTNPVFESAKRGVFLKDNRSRVIIQDEITAKKPSEFYWFAHANTSADITVAKDGKSALLELKGEKMLVRIIEGPVEAKIAVYDSKPLLTSPAPQEQSLSYGQKLAIHLQDVSDLQLAVEFVPLDQEEGIPAPSAFEKLDAWNVEESELLFDAKMGDAIALFLNSPVAFGSGRKMYVDENNYEVVPFTENGRTLVPVRFIAESFGADVGWDDATQTVSVDYLGRSIKMQIGSNVMTLNGEEIILDVPANTYNSRTLIPLRALSEALGKEVLWDDRGLIVIDDSVAPYEAMKDEIIACLDYRLTLDGKEMTMFKANETAYSVAVSPSASVAPVVGFNAVSGTAAQITQAATPNGTATVTVNGTTYTLNFVPDTFEMRPSNKDAQTFTTLDVKFAGAAEAPTQKTYIDATCYYQSGGSSYALTNTLDNDLTTRWSAEGVHYLDYDLGYSQQVGAFALATMNATSRAYRFELQYSNDGANWTSFYSGTTKMISDMPDQFFFAPVTARYIRLIGHGFQVSPWNSYTEVRFYTDAAQAAMDAAYFDYYFAVGDFSGKAGDCAQLILDCKTSDGTPIDMSKATVRYKSLDEKIAKVDANGVVTLVAPGTVRIGVEVTYGDCTKLESTYVECK